MGWLLMLVLTTAWVKSLRTMIMIPGWAPASMCLEGLDVGLPLCRVLNPVACAALLKKGHLEVQLARLLSAARNEKMGPAVVRPRNTPESKQIPEIPVIDVFALLWTVRKL